MANYTKIRCDHTKNVRIIFEKDTGYYFITNDLVTKADASSDNQSAPGAAQYSEEVSYIPLLNPISGTKNSSFSSEKSKVSLAQILEDKFECYNPEDKKDEFRSKMREWEEKYQEYLKENPNIAVKFELCDHIEVSNHSGIVYKYQDKYLIFNLVSGVDANLYDKDEEQSVNNTNKADKFVIYQDEAQYEYNCLQNQPIDECMREASYYAGSAYNI